MPSCMRAPPEAVTMTMGSRSAVASSNARVTFSPTTEPIEAAYEAEVHHGEYRGTPFDERPARDERLVATALLGGRHELIGVRLCADELKRVAWLDVGVHLAETALVGEHLDALGGGEIEVEAARLADAHRLYEFSLVDGSLAALALDPDAIGHLGTAGSRRFGHLGVALVLASCEPICDRHVLPSPIFSYCPV